MLYFLCRRLNINARVLVENRRVSFIVHWPLRKEEKNWSQQQLQALGKKREEREERKKQCSLPQRMISLCNLELIPALKQGFSKVWSTFVMKGHSTHFSFDLLNNWTLRAVGGERGILSTLLWSHCCDILLSFGVLSATLPKLLLLLVYTYPETIWRLTGA